MDLETFLRRRAEQRAGDATYQERCYLCLRPRKTCYCARVRRFDPGIHFVILIHPVEYRRRLATGRMSHLCLTQSTLILGHNFSQQKQIHTLIQDPGFQSFVLFPGKNATYLTALSPSEKAALVLSPRRLRIFVIDGTWSTAKGMLRLCPALDALPKICFVPPRPSHFRVRKQPKGHCFSTIEAIHHTIELLGPSFGFDLASRAHDNMLEVFDSMVDQHIALNAKARAAGRTARFRLKRVP